MVLLSYVSVTVPYQTGELTVLQYLVLAVAGSITSYNALVVEQALTSVRIQAAVCGGGSYS